MLQKLTSTMQMQTDPYPWPFDHDREARLTAERIAVVVCGWQHHWRSTLDPGADVDSAVTAITGLVDQLRSLGAGVIWVRNGSSSPTRPSRRPAGLPVVASAKWELLAGQQPDDVIIDTPGLDAFVSGWMNLELVGGGRDRLVMCGLGTEGPVSSTTRSANDRGYECLTAVDAVVHHDSATGAAMLSSICMSGGIFGAIGSASELIEHLSELNSTGSIRPTTP